MKLESVDYVVVGFSLAGIAAALTLAESGDRVVLVDFDQDTDIIGDLPRIQATELYPEASGSAFDIATREMLAKAGIQHDETSHVRSIYPSDGVVVEYSDKRLHCNAAIFAPNGTEPGIELEGVSSLYGFGVSFSPAADAPYFKGQPMAVYGDAPRVLEHAVLASRYASEVAVLLKGSNDGVDVGFLAGVGRSSTITVEENVQLLSLHASVDGSLESVAIRSSGVPAGGEKQIAVPALFIAQHLQPCVDIVRAASPNILLAGLAGGVPYWKHSELVSDGMRSAHVLQKV